MSPSSISNSERTKDFLVSVGEGVEVRKGMAKVRGGAERRMTTPSRVLRGPRRIWGASFPPFPSLGTSGFLRKLTRNQLGFQPMSL